MKNTPRDAGLRFDSALAEKSSFQVAALFIVMAGNQSATFSPVEGGATQVSEILTMR